MQVQRILFELLVFFAVMLLVTGALLLGAGQVGIAIVQFVVGVALLFAAFLLVADKEKRASVRRLLYLPHRLWYRYIYAPIASLIDDYRHRYDPPLPPVPCQICGKPGHKERYCPNTKGLGF